MADQIGDREIAYMPVNELGELYRRKELSPRSTVKVALDRIDAFNDAVNAFRGVAPQQDDVTLVVIKAM